MANDNEFAEEGENLKSDALIPNDIDRMIMKITSAMNSIGFSVEYYSIEDILLNDLSNINAFYQATLAKYGNTSLRERSYEFLYKLIREYGGRTLFDALENIYGEEAEVYNTNLQVELMKEIRKIEAMEKKLIINRGIKDLLSD